MKFRTELILKPSGLNIEHDSNIFMVGSCFSEHIAQRLTETKFAVASNPTGILFNPLSIYRCLKNLASDRRYSKDDLHFDNTSQRWFSYDFHGSFSGDNADKVVDGMNSAVIDGREALNASDIVFITFGSAFIFELVNSGQVVANCHKQPQNQFIRRKLGVDEIYTAFSELLKTTLKDKQVVFTISPVRHLADGLEGNFISKATLRLAIEKLENECDNVHYFPAFEIINDDLRDYRFYGDDLIHPSVMAVSYIWTKFVAWTMTKQMQLLIPKLEKEALVAKHRPINSTK
jgi:hypothetical protein